MKEYVLKKSNRTKYVYIISIFIVILTLLIGGYYITKEKHKKVSKSKSINMTITVNKSYKGGRLLKSGSYMYYEKNKKVKHIASVKHNAQYSITYYDKNSGLLYYTSNTDINRENGDELYSYNIKTHKKKQLTKGLYAVNDIIPIGKEKLLIIGVKGNSRVITAFAYNIKTQKLKSLGWDKDFNIYAAYRNPDNGKIYVSGYSYKKSEQIIDDLNNEKIKKGSAGSTVYEIFDDGSHKKIFSCNEKSISDFAIDENYILCSTYYDSNSIDMFIHNIELYDLNTKNKEKISKIQTNGGEILYFNKQKNYIILNNKDSITKVNTKNGNSDVLYEVDGIKNV